MPENQKISVIVPAYNNAPWLPRCLDSILAQAYQNLEIIVVNDGSRDDTPAIMDSYAERDPRVRTIHKENGGVTSARLAGVKAATGAWIGFVDGDDTIDPDMYQRLLTNALTYHADISHCGYRMVFSDGRINYFHNTGKLVQQDRNTGLTDLLQGTMVEPGLCNKLYRYTLIEQLLKRSTILAGIKINEDLLMNFLLFSSAKNSVFEDFCPYQYIVRENSASRQALNHHQIYDPITVKTKICTLSTPDSLDCARIAYLNTCIDVYNRIIMSYSPDLKKDRERIRLYILSHYNWSVLLGKKRRLLIRLIRFMPLIYRPFYSFYARHLMKNPYA